MKINEEIKATKKESMDMGWNFNNTYVDLSESLYSMQNPVPVKSPKLVIYNKDLGQSLGLNNQFIESNDGTAIFAGNAIPYGAFPIAQAYAGHQFAYFNNLGDGRAILLGEQITPDGQRFDIQLKGSGRTKYSRGGDGRAALGPMLREYIISEAMYNLGVPTTRSLAVVTSGENVYRESALTGAILTRVASSHIRVGTFQYVSAFSNKEVLKSLADYTIKRHFSNILSSQDKYLLFLRKVINKQAWLIANWQLLGFIHGVMNTDNMTISGETIDYGPCAFMDSFKLSRVFSSIDTAGRYSYANQPNIAQWNLARLADSLIPLIHDDESLAIKLATKEVAEFSKIYNDFWLSGMRKKLGMFSQDKDDKNLIIELFSLMEKYQADYTNTFRQLTIDKLDGQSMFDTTEFESWYKKWKKKLNKQKESKEEITKLMKDNNPSIIPRNHRVEESLAAAEEGDLSVMNNLLYALKKPYAYTKEQEEYTKLPTNYSSPYRTFCGT